MIENKSNKRTEDNSEENGVSSEVASGFHWAVPESWHEKHFLGQDKQKEEDASSKQG